jgi:hypothetical protein
VSSFFAFNPGFLGAVTVAVGDVTGSGYDDIIVAAGAGGNSNVKVFDGVTGAEVSSFLAFGASYQGALTVASAALLPTGNADVVIGTSANNVPEVITINPLTGEPIDAFLAYDPSFLGGVSVGGTNG